MTEDEKEILDFYESIYDDLCWQIQKHTDSGELPSSVVESMQFLIEFWLENKEKK